MEGKARGHHGASEGGGVVNKETASMIENVAFMAMMIAIVWIMLK